MISETKPKEIDKSSKVQSVDAKPLVIVVMGVSGCGKSTITRIIASKLSAHGKDGDELHPDANIKKMASGLPLSDDDRQPWLDDVAIYARDKAKIHGICVIACSALKKRYRQTLNTAGRVVYVFLQGSHDLIASRMHLRTGHFMPETLLDSQFDALEDPQQEPNVITVSIEPGPESIAENAVNLLRQGHYLQ